MQIKCKRYYKWLEDTEVSDGVCRKGEIFTHYQGMNESKTLLNREVLTDWLQFTTLHDRRGAELYDKDIVLTNNNQYFVIRWHIDKNKRKAGWKMESKGEWFNVDTSVIRIVGNEALDGSN